MQTVHYNHHINVIISAELNEMLVCCHPTVIYQLGLVNWREVCSAWPQPLDIYLFIFSFALTKMEKMFLELVAIKQFDRQQQTNNSLSPVLVNNSYSLPTIFLGVAYLNFDQFGGLLGSYLRGSRTVAMIFFPLSFVKVEFSVT